MHNTKVKISLSMLKNFADSKFFFITVYLLLNIKYKISMMNKYLYLLMSISF